MLKLNELTFTGQKGLNYWSHGRENSNITCIQCEKKRRVVIIGEADFNKFDSVLNTSQQKCFNHFGLMKHLETINYSKRNLSFAKLQERKKTWSSQVIMTLYKYLWNDDSIKNCYGCKKKFVIVSRDMQQTDSSYLKYIYEQIFVIHSNKRQCRNPHSNHIKPTSMLVSKHEGKDLNNIKQAANTSLNSMESILNLGDKNFKTFGEFEDQRKVSSDEVQNEVNINIGSCLWPFIKHVPLACKNPDFKKSDSAEVSSLVLLSNTAQAANDIDYNGKSDTLMPLIPKMQTTPYESVEFIQVPSSTIITSSLTTTLFRITALHENTLKTSVQTSSPSKQTDVQSIVRQKTEMLNISPVSTSTQSFATEETTTKIGSIEMEGSINPKESTLHEFEPISALGRTIDISTQTKYTKLKASSSINDISERLRTISYEHDVKTIVQDGKETAEMHLNLVASTVCEFESAPTKSMMLPKSHEGIDNLFEMKHEKGKASMTIKETTGNSFKITLGFPFGSSYRQSTMKHVKDDISINLLQKHSQISGISNIRRSQSKSSDVGEHCKSRAFLKTAEIAEDSIKGGNERTTESELRFGVEKRDEESMRSESKKIFIPSVDVSDMTPSGKLCSKLQDSKEDLVEASHAEVTASAKSKELAKDLTKEARENIVASRSKMGMKRPVKESHVKEGKGVETKKKKVISVADASDVKPFENTMLSKLPVTKESPENAEQIEVKASKRSKELTDNSVQNTVGSTVVTNFDYGSESRATEVTRIEKTQKVFPDESVSDIRPTKSALLLKVVKAKESSLKMINVTAKADTSTNRMTENSMQSTYGITVESSLKHSIGRIKSSELQNSASIVKVATSKKYQDKKPISKLLIKEKLVPSSTSIYLPLSVMSTRFDAQIPSQVEEDLGLLQVVQPTTSGIPSQIVEMEVKEVHTPRLSEGKVVTLREEASPIGVVNKNVETESTKIAILKRSAVNIGAMTSKKEHHHVMYARKSSELPEKFARKMKTSNDVAKQSKIDHVSELLQEYGFTKSMINAEQTLIRKTNVTQAVKGTENKAESKKKHFPKKIKSETDLEGGEPATAIDGEMMMNAILHDTEADLRSKDNMTKTETIASTTTKTVSDVSVAFAPPAVRVEREIDKLPHHMQQKTRGAMNIQNMLHGTVIKEKRNEVIGQILANEVDKDKVSKERILKEEKIEEGESTLVAFKVILSVEC